MSVRDILITEATNRVLDRLLNGRRRNTSAPSATRPPSPPPTTTDITSVTPTVKEASYRVGMAMAALILSTAKDADVVEFIQGFNEGLAKGLE